MASEHVYHLLVYFVLVKSKNAEMTLFTKTHDNFYTTNSVSKYTDNHPINEEMFTVLRKLL